MSGREEAAPEPSKSVTGQGRGKELPADTAAEQNGGKTSEEATAPSRRRTAQGARPRKTSSKLKEAIADSAATKTNEMADLKTDGLSRRKAAPRKAAKIPLEEQETLEEDNAVKRKEGKIEQKEVPVKKKRATKVGV